MIAYVDTAPIVELREGVFLFTAKSGDETLQWALTPHVAFRLQRQLNKATDLFWAETRGFEPTPLQRWPESAE